MALKTLLLLVTFLGMVVARSTLATVVETGARIADSSKKVTAVDIMAVEGKSVMLPCNVTPPGHDKVYMVFWFQDDAGIPLYSFDVRGKPLAQARHWSAPEVFGSRAYFRTVSDPAQLVIDDIKRHDEGVYRCRVDFRNTQTRSFRYNLTVIVPPEPPTILDRWGRKLNKTVGPYEEGDDVTLTCRVVGGKPEPKVRWLVNGVLADDEFEHNAGDVIENRLTWQNVGRQDLKSIFTCQAVNTILTEPKEATVVLDLHLKPLTVRIMKTETPLVADRRYEVACESTGSRPAAIITWYKGKRQLKRTKEDIRDNVTVSELSFVPTTEDDGKSITCRAENPNVTGLFLESSWKIDVVYPPIVSLRLGSTLNPDDIKEGDDVYFECHVKSNPQWRRLTWLHDGVVLNHNMSARIIRSNQSLVLQRVTRQSAGKYVCSAINSEGETISNELTFRVKYAPTCRQERILVVGASRAESLDIACEVEADPPARRYKWKFNNSGETLEVAPERFAKTSNGTVSVLRYTPVSDLDYGTLSCWASNNIGQQGMPCLFQVVAAGKPFPVRNCTLSNETSNSVEIACLSGFDGGLPQHFLLELYSSTSGYPRFNITSPEPEFLLSNLESDVTFRIVIFAVNSKGRSQGVVLEEITFRDAEKRTASDGDIPLSPILGVIIGLTLTLIIIIVYIVIKVRRNRDRNLQPQQEEKLVSTTQEQLSNSVKDVIISHREPLDECDPDIIPSKYDPNSPKQMKVCLNGPTIILRGVENNVDNQEFLHGNMTGAASQGYPTQWVTPGPAPVMEPLFHQYANPTAIVESASTAWDSRPKDLRISAPSTDRGADIELNGLAIKERLMSSRLPESCV